METTYPICSTTLVEQIINWWTEAIISKRADKFDSGEGSDCDFKKLIALIDNNVEKINKSQLEAFSKLLKKIVEESNYNCEFRSSRNPEGELANIIAKSGIPKACVPWETIMTVTPNKVEVSMGKDKPKKVLWKVK